VKYLALILFSWNAFGILPLTQEEFEKAMTDDATYEAYKKDFLTPCGFFKNIEDDKEFKEARRLLRVHTATKKALKDTNEFLEGFDENFKNNFEINRRRKEMVEAEEELRQLSCDRPKMFRKVIRQFDSMDGVMEALVKGNPSFDLILLREETLRFREAHEHYHAFKDSVWASKEVAQRDKIRHERNLEKIEKDPLYIKLHQRYNAEELEQLKNTEDLKLPKQIVINFEGTGQYSPKTVERIRVMNALAGVHMTNERRAKIVKHIWEKHDDENDYGSVTWPGTIHGPILQSVTGLDNSDDEKFKGHFNTQWLYFQSETQQTSRNTAMSCLKSYLYNIKQEYGENAPLPKVVIMGHSSGGYSAIKFANEVAKEKLGIYIDLVSIDPVIPYKEATLNGVGRSLNPFAKNRIGDHSGSGRFKVESKAVRATNFYQNQDVHGLLPTEDAKDWPIVGESLQERGVGLGIHGSEVEGAKNHHVKFEDGTYDARKGHGAISYCKDVTDFVKSRLK
jgi:hypothetical protein